MNQKVLLADDSLTIQKVIKITLANQPYDITDCSTEEELFKKLPEVKPRLVFLDFNLSDRHTGYELTAKIRSISPSTKVLLLLGTFDTVDDAAMEKCGASDKIVKPFDSNKFIAICKQLVDDTMDGEEIKYPDSSDMEEPDTFSEAPEEDQWTVNHTIEQKFDTPEAKAAAPVANDLNPLDKEVSDWGMSIPGIINDGDLSEKAIDLPPVIGEVKPLKTENDQKFPENNDLDYPVFADEKPSKPASNLISIDSLNLDALDSNQDFAIDHDKSGIETSDVSSIEAQIKDEVEENLWQADEFEDLKKEVNEKLEEAKMTYAPNETEEFDEDMFRPLDESEFQPSYESSTPSIDTDAMMKTLRADMEDMVKKYVQEYMDKMFEKNVEKITWDVIPDLAENLIRQELSKISKQILSDQDQ